MLLDHLSHLYGRIVLKCVHSSFIIELLRWWSLAAFSSPWVQFIDTTSNTNHFFPGIMMLRILKWRMVKSVFKNSGLNSFNKCFPLVWEDSSKMCSLLFYNRTATVMISSCIFLSLGAVYWHYIKHKPFFPWHYDVKNFKMADGQICV